MTDGPGEPVPATPKWLSIRLVDVLALQGTPLMGVAIGTPGALPTDWHRFGVFIVANALLVGHVFLFNDWADGVSDRLDRNRDRRILPAGMSPQGLWTLAVASGGSSLLLFAALSLRALVLAGLILALGVFYSFPRVGAKGVPVLSTAVHLVGGTLHFLLGYGAFGELDSSALVIAPFFALTFAAGHLIQEVRDYDADRANHVNTNAVRFGPGTTFLAAQVAFGLAFVLLALASHVRVIPQDLRALGLGYLPCLIGAWRATKRGLDSGALVELQRSYRTVYGIVGLLIVWRLLRS
jgi:4-hydroxybenzoate polyprenyltransferase